MLDASERAILKYTLPLAGGFLFVSNSSGVTNMLEIVTDFFSDLKSASSGFASFDYEEAGYEASDLVKVSYLVFQA